MFVKPLFVFIFFKNTTIQSSPIQHTFVIQVAADLRVINKKNGKYRGNVKLEVIKMNINAATNNLW